MKRRRADVPVCSCWRKWPANCHANALTAPGFAHGPSIHCCASPLYSPDAMPSSFVARAALTGAMHAALGEHVGRSALVRWSTYCCACNSCRRLNRWPTRSRQHAGAESFCLGYCRSNSLDGRNAVEFQPTCCFVHRVTHPPCIPKRPVAVSRRPAAPSICPPGPQKKPRSAGL